MALEQPTFDADTAARLLRRLRAAVAKAADGGAGATEPSNEVSEDVSEATAAALFAKVPSWWVEGVPRAYRNAHGVATHLWLDALRLDVPQLRALAAQTAPDATSGRAAGAARRPRRLGEALALLRAAARHAAELFGQKKRTAARAAKGADRIRAFLRVGSSRSGGARGCGVARRRRRARSSLGRSRVDSGRRRRAQARASTLVVPVPLSPARSTTASNVFDAMARRRGAWWARRAS